jgi:pimeloyl-[acyl-carrier protein] methyl ester esterase
MSSGALVLLPGMDGSEAMFAPFVRAAPPDIDPITVGYPAGGANTYRELLPAVQAVLPRERPFHLLGWSFGGPLALMAAAARPPMLRGVILAASFVTRPVPYLPAWARHLARPWLFRLYPAASQLKALIGGHATPDLRRRLADAHRGAGPEALACRVREALSIDATPELKACPVPLLYLRADADEVIPASHADRIRQQIPTLEIADITGPHLALVTNPAAAWKAITAFLARTSGPRAPDLA